MRSQRVQDNAAPQHTRKPCKQVYCVSVFDNGVLCAALYGHEKGLNGDAQAFLLSLLF